MDKGFFESLTDEMLNMGFGKFVSSDIPLDIVREHLYEYLRESEHGDTEVNAKDFALFCEMIEDTDHS